MTSHIGQSKAEELNRGSGLGRQQLRGAHVGSSRSFLHSLELASGHSYSMCTPFLNLGRGRSSVGFPCIRTRSETSVFKLIYYHYG